METFNSNGGMFRRHFKPIRLRQTIKRIDDSPSVDGVSNLKQYPKRINKPHPLTRIFGFNVNEFHGEDADNIRNHCENTSQVDKSIVQSNDVVSNSKQYKTQFNNANEHGIEKSVEQMKRFCQRCSNNYRLNLIQCKVLFCPFCGTRVH
ncbi:hypothetical protein ACOME3_007168 [Neoechinorhynchus agilis]